MTPVSLGIPTIRQQPPGDDGADPFAAGPLVDTFGRVHRDLRVSLTDKCSLRCTYCMPAEGVPWLPQREILTTHEIVRVVSVAVRLGITEVRLTGGEPLLRADITDVVARLTRLETVAGPLRVSLTTNGLRLPELMDELVAAGLERVNVSLDTVNAQRYHELTRRERFAQAVAGVEAVQRSGLRPFKINAVAMRGVNDDELCDLLRFAIAHEAELRFIEMMPLDAGHSWRREQMVTAEEILASLGREFRLTPTGDRASSPAEVFQVNDGPHTVGVIGSVTRPFCGACDRVRLTADGQLRNCLFAREESDLREILRGDAAAAEQDLQIARVMRAAILGKRAGHGINEPGFLQPDRPMSAIGG